MYKDKKFEEIEQAILEKYGDTYSKEDIKDAYSDISELEEKELLFTDHRRRNQLQGLHGFRNSLSKSQSPACQLPDS